MRAFIHAFRGKPWNEECEAAYNGFKKLGIECVLFCSDEDLADRTSADIVVGGMLVIGHILDTLGIITQNFNYPEELKSLLCRKIWTIKLGDLKKQDLPVFIKPLEEKIAQGIIIESISDIGEYEKLSPDTELLCSDVIDIVSEWRCFIRYGEIIGIKHYKGDKYILCNEELVKNAVEKCHDLPAGCSLDFGVLKNGRTCLVEMNDGFSLGCYGLDDVLYAKLLSARWAELTGTKDECAFDL